MPNQRATPPRPAAKQSKSARAQISGRGKEAFIRDVLQSVPDLESELWLITHPDLRNTARVRAFLDFCAEEIARRRPVLEGIALPQPAA